MPRVNKDRGDHWSVSVVYGGKHNQRCFHKMPQIKCCLVTGRDGTKVSAVMRTLIGHRFAFAPGRELLQGRASGSPWMGVPQSCGESPKAMESPNEQHGHPSPADSSYAHTPPSRCILSHALRFVRKYKHSLSSCRVAYPPASRGQTHVKISHRYQTGSRAS